MDKLKKFEDFGINESEAIHEDEQYYIDKGYISDPSIASKEDLIKKIEAEINPAFVAFVASHKLPIPNPKITITTGRQESTYIELKSDEVPEDQLGVFANPLESCVFMFFSGREISTYSKGEKFLFKPQIFASLNLSYSQKEGGSNGMSYNVVENGQGRGSTCIYDILSGEFSDILEARAKEKTAEK